MNNILWDDILAVIAIAIIFMFGLAAFFLKNLGQMEKAKSCPQSQNESLVVIFGKIFCKKCGDIFGKKKK